MNRRWTGVGVALWWALAGCATSHKAGLKPACQDKYNACMDACSQGPIDPRTGKPTPGFASPSCADDCDEQSKNCR